MTAEAQVRRRSEHLTVIALELFAVLNEDGTIEQLGPAGEASMVELMNDIRKVYDRAVADLGPDTVNAATLDLMADNFPDRSLNTLREALMRLGLR
jgi:hypothetical protein